jgi:hypothetical protein
MNERDLQGGQSTSSGQGVDPLMVAGAYVLGLGN